MMLQFMFGKSINLDQKYFFSHSGDSFVAGI